MSSTPTDNPVTFERASARTGVVDLRALGRPLPATLVEMLPRELVEKHLELAHRYGSAIAALAVAVRKLADAGREDEKRAADAVRDLKPLPKPTEPTAQRNRDDAARELKAVSAALADSADGLLIAAASLVASAADEASNRHDELVDHVAGQLEHLLAELDRAAGYISEATWLAQAGELVANAGQSRRPGRVRPYTDRRLPTETSRIVRDAVDSIHRAEQRRADAAEWRRRQAEAELPPPPTSPPNREAPA